jgi:hypothetical protein
LRAFLVGIALWLCTYTIGAQNVSARISGNRAIVHPAGGPALRRFMVPVQIDTNVRPGSRDFLEPNAPNPFGVFNRETKIGFTIAEEGHVRLRVYDFFYNEVVTLVDSTMLPGRTVVRFIPPPTMPSGMYFYELKTSRVRELRRMLYIK